MDKAYNYIKYGLNILCVGMYGQRLCGHVSLISHPYGDSSAPPLFRHRDPYDPLLSVDRRTRTCYHIAIAVPPG